MRYGRARPLVPKLEPVDARTKGLALSRRRARVLFRPSFVGSKNRRFRRSVGSTAPACGRTNRMALVQILVHSWVSGQHSADVVCRGVFLCWSRKAFNGEKNEQACRYRRCQRPLIESSRSCCGRQARGGLWSTAVSPGNSAGAQPVGSVRECAPKKRLVANSHRSGGRAANTPQPRHPPHGDRRHRRIRRPCARWS